MTRLLLLLAAAVLLHAEPRTVLEGVYTEAQARRGMEAYDAKCGSCHKPTLDGGAEALPLRGQHFLETWRDDTLFALFNHMQTRMPRRPVGEPGTLPRATYVDIVAYILKVNEYPAGSQELTEESLGSIMVVGPEGPRPLATNTVVQTVGCFAQGPKDTWLLLHAGALERIRATDPSAPVELERAQQKPLGAAQYRLTNLDDFKPNFAPEPVKGKKVLVKGPLTRSSAGDRIFVLQLEELPGPCTP